MNDAIAELVKRDGWRAEGAAARVHYEGAGDRFAVEYYASSNTVLYWSIPDGDPSVTAGKTDSRPGPTADVYAEPTAGTATPVARESVPNPLRERIRRDLAAAGVDSAVERRKI